MKPMLLFNMLDAVLSKHKDANSDSVVQTENATQDIIQKEMENLDSMLIATPILPTTLTKPSSADSPSIYDTTNLQWKPNIRRSKLPTLSDFAAQTLAASCEFGGGQIDNIVRKSVMQEAVKGEKPTLDSLKEMRSLEKISKNTGKRRGFC